MTTFDETDHLRDRVGRFAKKPDAPEVNDRLYAIPSGMIGDMQTDGTFRYPPHLRSADEAIDFWSTVEIPDEACDQLEFYYEDTFDEVVEILPGRMWENGGRDAFLREREGFATNHDLTEGQAAYEAQVRERLLSRPRRLPRENVRTVLRAAALYDWGVEQATRGDEEQFFRAVEHEFSVVDPMGNETTCTANDLVKATGVATFRAMFLDDDNWVDVQAERRKAAAREPAVDADEARRIVQQETAALEGRLKGYLGPWFEDIASRQVESHEKLSAQIGTPAQGPTLR